VRRSVVTQREKLETTAATDRQKEIRYRLHKIDRNAVLKERKVYWFFKRLQDIVFSAIGLVVLWPILLVIALLIVIDDPKGSPIFSQKRCGRDGKEFNFYKFRSMHVDAENKLEELLEKNEMEGPVFKIKEDPRITRLGKVLRKTGLDELPQMVNILRGDMSIVGPRPPLPREVEQYNEYQMQRLIVTPGLTCYWQIQPHRNDLTFDEWVDLDVKYIYERSFLVDWKIIVATVRTVLAGDGE
jgi:lipopolysaccharide/colanic/teichoic acid biosynthesis glycosyltransferase